MSFQANSVSVTSVIFIVVPPRASGPDHTTLGAAPAPRGGRREPAAPEIRGGTYPTLFIDYMRIFVYKSLVAFGIGAGVRPPALQGRLLQGPRPPHPDPAPRGPARPRAERPGAPGGAGARPVHRLPAARRPARQARRRCAQGGNDRALRR